MFDTWLRLQFQRRQSVLLQAGRQLVTVRRSVFPEHIEHNRFHKPVNISHGAGAWIPTGWRVQTSCFKGALLGMISEKYAIPNIDVENVYV